MFSPYERLPVNDQATEGPPFDTDTPPTPGGDIAISPKKSMALAVKQVNAIEQSFQKAAVRIAALAEKHQNVVFDLSTTKGMDEAKAVRIEIRNVRFGLQNAEKDAKKPLNQIKDAISTRADELVEMVLKIEAPIDAQIKAAEKAKADAKAERERIELETKTRIDDSLTAIRETPMVLMGKTAAEIDAVLKDLAMCELTLDAFGDRAGEAEQVRAQAVERLQGMHAAALALEAQREALAKQQEALRAEQDAAVERERASRAQEAERLEAERQKLADERAEMQRQQAELDESRRKLQEAQAAEAKRIEDAAAAERLRVEEAERAERMRVEEEERTERERLHNIEVGKLAARAALRDEIAAIGKGYLANSKTAAEVEGAISAMSGLFLDPDRFGDLHAEACIRVESVIATLNEMHKRFTAQEAEQARAAADRRVRDAAPALRDTLIAMNDLVLNRWGYPDDASGRAEVLEQARTVLTSLMGETE